MENSLNKSNSRTNLLEKNKSKYKYENENAAFIEDQQQRQQVILFFELIILFCNLQFKNFY